MTLAVNNKMRILAMQCGIPRLNQLEYKNNVPLGAGYLFSYLKHQLKGDCPLLQLLPRTLSDILSVEAVVDYVKDFSPDLLLVTLDLWNITKSLEIVQKAKFYLPKLLVIYGGPEVNSDNNYLLNSPEFTIGVCGEGEIPLLKLLMGADPADIPGLIYRKDGAILANKPTELNEFIAEYNPYLSGVIQKGHDDCMFFETVRGCPFSCNFCYYNKTYKNCHFWPFDIVDKNIRLAINEGYKEIFLLDPSFNVRYGFEEFVDKIIDLNSSKSLEFHTELRVDLLKKREMDKLVQMNLKGLEAGLQTINPEALLLMGRQQNINKFSENITYLQEQGVNCMVDLIVGLPGDSLSSFKKTADWVKERGLDSNIQVFNLSILTGTTYNQLAKDLELNHQTTPPYYLKSTPQFSEDDIKEAFKYAKDLFGIELDPIHPPLLSTDFSRLKIEDFRLPNDNLPYLSKLLINHNSREAKNYKKILAESSTIHFRTSDFKKSFIPICQAINDLTWEDPSRIIEIVIETETEFDLLLISDMLPYLNLNFDHFVNRDVEPFSGDGVVLSTRIIFVLPKSMADSRFYNSLAEDYQVYLRIEGVDDLLRFCDGDINLYAVGSEQEKIWQFMLQNEMVDYPLLFDDFQIEWQKILSLDHQASYFMPTIAII